jgi:hypothetical protein
MMTRFLILSVLGTLQAALFAAGALADAPPCMAHGKELPVNNQQVLMWKKSTPNAYLDRGHVLGKVTVVYPDRNGHQHFSIQIGPQPTDIIEVVYSVAFGQMPRPEVGESIEACGDYITSTAQTGNYPPSPAGAIVHWVHINPKHSGHDDGYVIQDNTVYGNRYNGH